MSVKKLFIQEKKHPTNSSTSWFPEKSAQEPLTIASQSAPLNGIATGICEKKTHHFCDTKKPHFSLDPFSFLDFNLILGFY